LLGLLEDLIAAGLLVAGEQVVSETERVFVGVVVLGGCALLAVLAGVVKKPCAVGSRGDGCLLFSAVVSLSRHPS
jgi:hypothetical protein